MTQKLFVYLSFCIFMLTFGSASSKRPCEPCASSDYPVCATNGTHWFLFRNECRLNTENRKREKNQAPTLQKTEISNCFKKCDQVCTNEYAPICARSSDAQKTFQNRCELDLENCKTGYNWTILHEGECPAQPQPTTARPPPLPPQPIPPIPPSEDECPTYCALEYKPICASLGDVDQTFQNLCYLKAEMCASRREWQIKYDGECVDEGSQCDEDCPNIYSPMCATYNGENRTFSNECFLDLEICASKNQWDILHKGECRDPPEECQTICPEIYQPVCATNNGEERTFPNKCFVGVEVCKTKKAWKVLYEGECAPPPKQPSHPSKSPELPTKNCPDACTANYDPVCASFEGTKRTFSNGCELGVEACKTGNNWKILFKGECEKGNDVYEFGMKDSEVGLCPANYDPICAAFNGETRTFSNKCQMDAETSRTNQVWEIVGQGECEKRTSAIEPTGPCPKCSNFYQPVCGFFNGEQKTFTNQCQLLGENCYSKKKWVVVYEGECKVSDQPRNCPNICPLNYDPVCASFNGIKRTFPNECELNHESYKTDAQWVILNRGECDYCPICSDGIDPVCAEYNGQIQTFDNACKMEYENCKTGSEWKVISRNSCEDEKCSKFCPRIYSPVCASNNDESRTFANICEMKVEACNTNIEWIVVSEGECPPPNVNCPKVCTLNYKPVCAMHQGVSRSFDNECLLRAEICKTNKNWLFVHPGVCSDQTNSRPVNHRPEPTYPGDGRIEQVSNEKLLFVLLNRLQSNNGKMNPNTYSVVEEQPVRVNESTPPPIKCQIVQCMDIYDPVCAVYNGQQRTFTNACSLDNMNCRYDESWEIISNGSCRQPIQRSRAPYIGVQY